MAGAGGWRGGGWGGTLWAIALRTKKGKWVRGEREVSVGVTLPKPPSNWGAPRARDAQGIPTWGCPPPGDRAPRGPLGHLRFSRMVLPQFCWNQRLSLSGREDLPQ